MKPRHLARFLSDVPTITDPPTPDWEGALCAEVESDLWFPDTGRNDIAHQAIRICQRCPLRQTCLDYAIANRERHGVWGGLTERQRRPLTHDTEGTAA